MSALDFSPAPGAAPAGRRIWSHGLTEAKLMARNGEQFILALVIPAAILIGGRFVGERFSMSLDQIAPSVLALALLSTGFTSLAISTGFERRYNVLERLASTPLTKTGLLAGKAVALGIVAACQLTILKFIAFAVGWRPEVGVLPVLIGVVAALLGLLTFASFGLLLAGTMRAEAILAIANLLYLVLMMAGGVMLPLSLYPPGVREVVGLLPTAAVGEAMRNAGTDVTAWWPLAVLAVWAIAGVLLARKGFRWMS